MDGRTKCNCRCCVIGGLMWPAVLITLGTLFLVGRLGWGYSFGKLWPVLLVVMGVIKLAQSLASTEGHIGP